MSAVATTSLWATAVACGLMAGVYFAFSTFVMRALAAMPKPQGIAAMQAINRAILASPFMPLFLLTSLASLALAIWGFSQHDPRAHYLVLGGAVYLVGMFGCTVAFNVPLNDRLQKVEPTTTQATEVWALYLRSWTRWNHVRTVSSTAACALFSAGACV